ncbi:MAG: DUF927 domain-containing protein [Psychrobacter cryohalolentis]
MNTPKTTSHEKAHAFSAGFTLVINSFDAVTRQGLADDKLLLKIFDLLPPNSLLSVTDNLTTNDASLVPTAGTIALRLHDKQGDIVGAVFYTPNSKAKPIVIDPTGYGAIVIGDTNKANEVIAFDDAEHGIDAYQCMADDKTTFIISPQKTKQCFKKMVQHWSSGSLLTVPMTIDNKGMINLLAGVNARALVTMADIVTMLHANHSYEAILAADDTQIINLKDTAYYPEWRDDPQLNEPMIYADGRFELYHDGLFFVKYNDDDPSNILFKLKMRVCSPLEVIAKTRDTGSTTWGRLLQWRDDDGVLHTWSMPISLLQGDAREYRRELASQGLDIEYAITATYRSYLDVYIQKYPIHKRALCVDKLGWHDEQYVLPDGAIGNDSKELIVYQSAHSINSTIAQQGTLAQWRDELCKKLADQSRFVFSIACAFAGQLLELLDDDGGGFHILGSSSMGKSLSLKLAASVWGNPDKYVKTWRSTDNALEGTASEHNDSFLPLDEISESDPKIIGKAAYMLANGKPKGRSTTTGHNRIAKTWRIIFLSNGEESLQNFMAQAGQKTNAGIEVRVAHIDADAGKGLKTFDSLVLADTGAGQADKIKELSQAYYGVAGIAWLEHITSDKAATTATAKQFVSDFMSNYSDLAPQAYRVAKRFAIVAAAGEMATQANITGWQAGQATTAVMTCLDNWLDNYGRDGEHEQRQIIKHIQAFIEQHGSSRFEPRHSHKCADFEPKTSNRVGYRNIKTGDYYFMINTFDTQVCQPFSSKSVLQVLDDANLLLRNQGDRKAYRSPETLFINRDPFYVVKANILSYETDKSIVTDVTDVTDHNQYEIDPVTHTKTATGRTGRKTAIC